MKRLIEIQQKLKAPKSQHNSFWNYNYRSCEDILLAVKPLLAEQKLVLILEDSIEMIWERYYVKATAKLFDEEWKLITQTSAYAREDESKKWYDVSQISWSSSSYARKYCLSWMLLCDDWIDADTTNKWQSEAKSEKKSESKEEQKETKRFNKEQFEKLKWNTEYLKKFESSEALLQDIYNLWYAVSKEMKMKIADVRASVE